MTTPRFIMFWLLAGASLGWACAATALAFAGSLNIGGMLPGLVVAVLWLVFIASSARPA